MKQDNRSTLYAVFVFFLALGIRLYHLGSQSLWIDEGFSLRDIHGLDLLSETRPMYFLLMRGWMALGVPHTEFFMRLPAAILGASSVWILFILGRKLIGDRPAVLASLFLAVSVLQVNHSREIRMYTLVVFTVLLSTYFLMLALERRKIGYAIGYTASMLAGLLTSALVVLIMLAHGIFLLLYFKSRRPMSTLLIGVQLLIFGAWFPWLRNNMQASQGYADGYTSIIERPTLRGLIEFFGKFFIWKWSYPGKLLVIASILFSVAILVLAIKSLKNYRKGDAGLTLTWLWLVVPLAGMIAASYTIANMWMIHYLIDVSPAVFLLVSKGIFSLNKRFAIFAAASFVLFVTLGRLAIYMKTPTHPQWRSAVSYVESHEHPGDVTGIYYGGNEYVFRYYYHGKAKWSPLGDDELNRIRYGKWNDKMASKLINTSPYTGKRFWLVMSNHEYGGGPVIVDYISKHYRMLDHKYYSQMEMVLFDQPGSMVPNDRQSSH